MKTISVITTLWNRSDKRVPMQLMSLRYGNKPDEIIVVDTSDDLKHAARTARRVMDARIYGANISLISTPFERFNISKAFNIGARLATSDYLMFIGADMFFSKWFVDQVKRRMESNKVLLAVCGYLPRDFNPIKPLYMQVDQERIGHQYSPAAIQVMRREWFLSIGGYDERFTFGGEDDDMIHRARKSGKEIEWIEFGESVVYCYHIWHEQAPNKNESSHLFLTDERIVRNGE